MSSGTTGKKQQRERASRDAGDASLRELLVARDIAHAFLTSENPERVFELALERVTPIVGAAFASVYLVDPPSELMRLAAAHNWPERFRPWLGQMRVRIGFGPSGQAVAERRLVEVPDVYAGDDLEDWQEVAAELGFGALIALPLESGAHALGALTFYFADAAQFSAEKRDLVRLVADQLAATAEKARLIDELRRANAALTEANTALQRQNEALVDARRAKDEFLANISHELRTPLTAVLGYIALMQEGLSGPLTDGQRNDLAQVTRASERLLHLIDALLELTTLKRGELDVQAETFAPAEALRTAVAAARPPAGVVLRAEEPGVALPPVHSDRRKIVRVLSILLDNAIKFTESGEVVASVEVRGEDRLAFRVRDTGGGIPAAAHALVFEEFRQVDGSATRRHGGSGLGLALARQLARAIGGELAVASEVGAGATFTLEIPLAISTPAGHRPAS